MHSNSELQLLSVTLTDDIYGIDITKVQEIRALGKHRSLPKMPKHCVGVIDFRNSMVPVLDLREMFGYRHEEVSPQTVIVVLLIEHNAHQILLGIVVDSVSDVIAVQNKDLRESPSIGAKVDTSFIRGMFKHEDNIVVVLALDTILESDAISDLKAFVQNEQVSV